VFLKSFIARPSGGLVPLLLEHVARLRPLRGLFYFRYRMERTSSPFPFVPAFLRFSEGLFECRKARVFSAWFQLVCLLAVPTFYVTHIDARVKAHTFLDFAAVNRCPVKLRAIEYPTAAMNACGSHPPIVYTYYAQRKTNWAGPFVFVHICELRTKAHELVGLVVAVARGFLDTCSRGPGRESLPPGNAVPAMMITSAPCVSEQLGLAACIRHPPAG